MPAARPTLTVYARSYCHLCDDMIAALQQLQGRFVFEIKVVDVDSDPVLEAHYDHLVPVLTAPIGEGGEGERELCHYFLDEPAVTAFLTEIR
jgi:thiol-disulfide isomerase/thioredoxin